MSVTSPNVCELCAYLQKWQQTRIYVDILPLAYRNISRHQGINRRQLCNCFLILIHICIFNISIFLYYHGDCDSGILFYLYVFIVRIQDLEMVFSLYIYTCVYCVGKRFNNKKMQKLDKMQLCCPWCLIMPWKYCM